MWDLNFNDEVTEFFQLNEKQKTALEDLGEKARQFYKDWEKENVKISPDENFFGSGMDRIDVLSVEVPSPKELGAEVREEYLRNVQNIIGREKFILVAPALSSWLQNKNNRSIYSLAIERDFKDSGKPYYMMHIFCRGYNEKGKQEGGYSSHFGSFAEGRDERDVWIFPDGEQSPDYCSHLFDRDTTTRIAAEKLEQLKQRP